MRESIISEVIVHKAPYLIVVLEHFTSLFSTSSTLNLFLHSLYLRILEGCVPQWVEVLVTLAHDEFPLISDFARLALDRFPSGGHTLSSLMGAQLHTLVSSLPRLIRHHDDTR